MSVVTINRKVLERVVGKKLTDQFLQEKVSMMGAVLENVNPDQLEVEVFPSRPDLLSEQGFARAFSSFIGVATGLKNYTVIKSNQKVVASKSLPKEWPYVVACIVKGLKFSDERIKEVIQIQEKLGLTLLRKRKKGGLGLYPLEKITFPIAFEGRKPEEIKFRPLEFPNVITGRQVLSQHPTGRAYAHICENWEKFPIFVDAQNEIMSMPPIINSHLMGKITEDTKDVFIEATGTDLSAITLCLNILVTSLAEMGGTIYSLEVQQKDGTKMPIPNLNPQKMKLDLEYINKRLGLELKEKEAKFLLEKMGLGYEKGQVLIPAYRNDVLHQVDLAEDIAIAFGYENFPEVIPRVSTIAQEHPVEKFSRKIREILVGLELIEAKNLHLMTELDLNQRMHLSSELIPLKNVVGEFNTLRNSLLPSLMKNLSDNQHNEYPQNLFEIGRVFNYGNTETGVLESEHLGVVLCYDEADFTKIRQLLDFLMKNLGLSVKVKDAKYHSFIPGRVGEILVEGEKIGVIGEIHPQVLTNWNISVPAVSLELNLEKLFEKIKK
jgi:phenylalanyl-tRNA synthetase beta chain